jgi:signal transduction histidine kinase/ActR/RegA family two-component response regulator
MEDAPAIMTAQSPDTLSLQGAARARVQWDVFFSLALLALACGLVLASMLSTVRATRWVDQSWQVAEVVTQLFGAVEDAESGQRGYLLTGNENYLKPYYRALQTIPGLKSQLSELVEGSALHRRQLGILYPLIDTKLSELSNTIEDRKAQHTQASMDLVRSDIGRSLMDEIRLDVDDFIRTENVMLRERNRTAEWQRNLMMSAVLVMIVLAGMIAFVMIRRARRHATDMHAANLAQHAEMLQREAAESQLRQSQKMEALGQLTGGVAHDFNNMLAVIVGNLEMLIRRLPEQDGRNQKLAENAFKGAMRAAELTRSLLAFSRQQPLKPKAVDVNQCVSDMSTMLRRAIGEDIQIEVVQGVGLWRAYVDRPQLESAILNLAVNSRDAMSGSGRLTIETANALLDQAYADAHEEVVQGQYVMVAVTDTGAGMPPEVINRAFDPFFTTKEVGQGTGLGLSQVHGFARQSRGHVKIYSQVGIGTTIKIYLPRDTSDKSEAEPPRPTAVELPRVEQRKVLVVEDEADVRAFALSALQDLGYETAEADSASAALDMLARDEQITVLLTDVVMPGVDGPTLLDQAKGIRPDIAVLFMTGYTRNAVVHNGMLDQGVRLISKPFTLDELARELRATIFHQAPIAPSPMPPAE